jgi:TonB-dependent receptor
MKKALKSLFIILSGLLISQGKMVAQTTIPAPTSVGPMGKISGKIIDKANAEALIGVIVKVKDQVKGAQSDVEGHFTLKLPVGTYDLTLSYISYKTEVVQSVEVKEGQVTELDLTMEENITQTEEVVVIGKVQKETNNFLLIERKNSAQVSDGISSELIKKTPDRTTGDVLKRVTGASIQEGKFAIIRGMNDRYNAGYLNDAPLPSTESDRKAFSFDVIPANLIDNLVIVKAGTPDVTGDFAGGVIQIRTKAIPDKFTQSINIGGQYNSMATFKEATTFKRFKEDVYGLVNDDRRLPDVGSLVYQKTSIKVGKRRVTKENIDSLLVPGTKLFNNDWSMSKLTALPNGRFAYSVGLPIKVFKRDLGVVAALTYANTRGKNLNEIKSFDNSNENKLDKSFVDNVYTQNITSGAILNLSYKLNDKNSFGIRNFYNINTDFFTNFRTGSFGMASDGESKVKSVANWMTYNRLYTTQLHGEHAIGKNPVKIKWYVNRASIVREMPDYKIANYTSSVDNPDKYGLSITDYFRTGCGRFFSTMNEELKNGELNLSKHFTVLGIKNNIKVGMFLQKRQRSFTSRTFVYGGYSLDTTNNPFIDLGADNIKNPKGVYLKEKTANTDAYDASSNLMATYAMLDNQFGKLRAVYGARLEKFDQRITSYQLDGIASVGGDSTYAPVYDWLPSLNLSYALTEKTNLRVAAYKTLNRPEFRELASFAFYRFDIDSDQLGKKNLTRAKIFNTEMRVEYFPTAGQVISGGAFFKNVTNPIENKLDLTQVTRTFGFNNEKEAKVYGVELEFRKNLAFIKDVSLLQNTTVYANLALVKSVVSFIDTATAYNRPLQGQSPYIINTGITHENVNTGWSFSAALNRNGKRLAFVGANPIIAPYRADVYEQPRTVIDLQVAKNIGKFNLKATWGDILHQDQRFIQEGLAINTKKEVVSYSNELFRYKMPWTLTLSAGVMF